MGLIPELDLLILALAPLPVEAVAIDRSGVIRWVNACFSRATGYSAEETAGVSAEILDPEQAGTSYRVVAERVLVSGKAWQGEMARRRRDGRSECLFQTVTPIYDSTGEIRYFLWVAALTAHPDRETSQGEDAVPITDCEGFRNITALRRLEDHLRQAQRMESVARLAGGIARDFTNDLTIVNGYSELLLRQIRGSNLLRSYASEIRKAGQHAARLTRQLQALSRTQVLKPQVLDLNATVMDCLPMLRHVAGEDIVFEMKLGRGLGQILADADQIHEILINLAVNAREVMPEGGTIEIQTENREVRKGGPSNHPAAKVGRFVVVTVKDNGSGIKPGLSTVYGIVTQSGGWVEVSSKVGKGTSFQIFLPRLDTRKGVNSLAQAGMKTVLVVDDQEILRTHIRRVLEEHGYHVIEAPDGHAAIEAVRKHSREIHLLLTDVVMPGINGRELSERLTATIPTLKVLFISGYSTEVLFKRGVDGCGMTFISKPFTAEQLLRRTRELLASGGASSAS
jgi:PAS domain S-box-containing protein